MYEIVYAVIYPYDVTGTQLTWILFELATTVKVICGGTYVEETDVVADTTVDLSLSTPFSINTIWVLY